MVQNPRSVEFSEKVARKNLLGGRPPKSQAELGQVALAVLAALPELGVAGGRANALVFGHAAEVCASPALCMSVTTRGRNRGLLYCGHRCLRHCGPVAAGGALFKSNPVPAV